MSFKDSVETDIQNIFLNIDEFAEKRDVTYDGTEYSQIPVVLTGVQEKDRTVLQSDHATGLYMVSYTMHCDISDIGGVLPEKGTKIRISEGSFFRDFYIASSHLNVGMLKLELEAIDE